ncbi:coiled-coil domain-containing 147-like protein [Obelidium mucronatum]|nr:coiled-coil domain-containing 147-like protein [Obelidium mucronatum]
MDNNASDDTQDAQDAAFFLCETEFQTTLDGLDGDAGLERFRLEYEKMHKARAELEKEARVNAVATEEAARVAVADQLAIRQLKDQIASAEVLIEANNKNEENLRVELRQLRLDISSLNSQLKQGVGLSVAQERTLNDLIANKDTLSRELEAEEIDSEIRNKERLERDLRELRIVVAVKSQEVRVKQDAVNRATDDISILESQIKTQKQMLDKLLKGREGLQARTAKLQEDCSEQISLTNQLIQENDELAKELKQKEIVLHKNKLEVKKVNRIKEALIKKNRSLEEEKIEAEMERKKLRADNEAAIADLEKTHRSIDLTKKAIDDLTRENDILAGNTLKTTDETAKHVDHTIILRQSRHNIEVELARENKEIVRQLNEIKHLEQDRDRCIHEAARLQQLCIDGMQQIKAKETEIFEYKKKMIQADTKLKHKQNLYEAVQSDRNLHAKHLIESQSEIAEMKRKLKIMNYQINGYKEDINSKYEALAKEDSENAKLAKDIEIISDEVKTLKNQNELAQSYIRSQLAEEMKLNQFVKEADLERTRQENALQVLISERDNLSSQLIRQNEELAKAYNKIKTQQSSLIPAIQTLMTKIHTLRAQDDALAQEISDSTPNKKLIRKLTNEITCERTRIKALQDELENPVNVHRWRKLEGSNPKAFEMIQLLHTLQKNLIAKTKEVKEKEEVIQNKEELYLHLKAVLGKQVGPEAIEQVEEFQKILKEKNIQLKHMNVELNMYHAQVREYKHALDVLNRGLKQVKDDYYDMKKSGRLPKLPKKAEFRLPPISHAQNAIVAAAADPVTSTEGMSVTEISAAPPAEVTVDSIQAPDIDEIVEGGTEESVLIS